MTRGSPKDSWKVRYVAHRNRVFANPRFQYWAAKLPLIRRIAKTRAGEAFDLVAGFTYSQILRAYVESGLFDVLATGPVSHRRVAAELELSEEAAKTLLRAGRPLALSEEPIADGWMLGESGAVLAADMGAQAMIRHHRLLYRDLADPLELLRKDRKEPTELSRYWSYAGALHGAAERGQETSEYSQLMAASQHFVADQVLASFTFPQSARLLDVGGGHGAFLSRMGEAFPSLQLGLFDLPEVAQQGAQVLTDRFGNERVSAHPGNFFEDPIPTGYDIVSLVRILHDHDDEPASRLLANIRASLAPGGRLLIAEPMARAPGAQGMGEAFFGLYLWAMGSGRARSVEEISAMLRKAGFSKTRSIATPQPVNASIIVASA
ncbi:methyltransferase [Erythrobacter sp. KY5]|uniref:methyltransferase n=1 Tax=Erythrobacter sp. KY5 TaxID=2011159 RepID=UPI000DBF346A|nr:methyltransferase [Erythrobacter sp. KY5]AWW75517.1 methyltransferase [Erythrobacter sp. KY5]